MIEVRNLTKSYRVKTGRHYVFREVNAVFPEGANIGIIGPNGGGKSTFLRILGGIDHPDSGAILSDRSFSWPLGLKGGFVSHLSGRENCRMICNLYGLHPRNTKRQLGKIKELSGIGEYFEEPVKHYSSGMGSRLGFALSMSFDFDYFLIDEITAVGDAQFKELAKQALVEKAQRSRVIMVSHNMGDIKKFCDVGVVVKGGRLTVYQDLDDAIREYLPQTKETTEDATELLREASLDELGISDTSVPKELKETAGEIAAYLKSIRAKLNTPGCAIAGSEADFYSRLAMAIQQLGDHVEAEKYHQKAVSEDPYNFRSQCQLAVLARRRNDVTAERQALDAAEEIDPLHRIVLLNRAHFLARTGSPEQAMQILEKLLKQRPGDPNGWHQRSMLFHDLGRIDKALDAAVKAVRSAPNNPDIQRQLSKVLAASGEAESSVFVAYKASIHQPSSPLKRYREISRILKSLDDQATV